MSSSRRRCGGRPGRPVLGRVTASLLGALLGLTALGASGCDDKKATTAPPASASAASAAPSASAAPGSTTAAAAGPSASGSGSAAAASAATAAPDAVAAQHVLVAYKGAKSAPAGVTRSKVEAKKRAEEVFAKAKGGADFSALVAEYSDDPGSKDRQGSVGKFTREKMTKPFSDAAFALRVDEVSAPVETPFGFHVIKRNQ